ncbi:MAG TPA: ACT domain-containing protein [Terriglobales bacterium]|nr:ACT domain-containing protein [Terriglobales bacterium]
MRRPTLKFSRVPGSFAVCRLAAGASVPDWALHGRFCSVTRTADELSVVCPEDQVPPEVQHENQWACLKLEGPFPFSETGILTSFVQPLSERAIPIFAVSTFDTDYVLVKEAWIEKALEVLTKAGHQAL